MMFPLFGCNVEETTDPCPNSSHTIEDKLIFEDNFENNCIDTDYWETNV